MVNKLDEVSASISTELYDVVVITETWLNSRVTAELIRKAGYVSCRRDRRNNQRRGCLCTYFNSQRNFTESADLSEPEIVSQWFLIRRDVYHEESTIFYWEPFTILLRAMTMFFECISLNV
jgi:hypothetical protein